MSITPVTLGEKYKLYSLSVFKHCIHHSQWYTYKPGISYLWGKWLPSTELCCTRFSQYWIFIWPWPFLMFYDIHKAVRYKTNLKFMYLDLILHIYIFQSPWLKSILYEWILQLPWHLCFANWPVSLSDLDLTISVYLGDLDRGIWMT